MQRLTECLEKEGFDPALYTFEVEDTKSTADSLLQILEEMAELSAKSDQHGAKTDQQLAAMNAKADHQHAKMEQACSVNHKNYPITSGPHCIVRRDTAANSELRKEISQELQQQVQQELEKLQEQQVRFMQ